MWGKSTSYFAGIMDNMAATTEAFMSDMESELNYFVVLAAGATHYEA